MAAMTKRNKLFIIIAIAVVLLGSLTYLYSAYGLPGSKESTADSRTSQKVSGAAQKEEAGTVSNQQESTKNTVAASTDPVTLSLHANSGNEPVNTVQTVITYPTDSLALVSITPGTAFSNEVATDTKTPGVIKIARAVSGSPSSVSGDQVVAKLTFKPSKAVDVTSLVSVDKTQSYLVTSTDNRNLIGTSSASLTLRR